MKRVVYVLGAGFSAPLDIPVMKNFVDKARNIRRDNESYSYFDDVIRSIQDTVRLSSYFSHDSSNIEEALSVLEMRRNLNGDKEWKQLQQFIKDVVKVSTPPVPKLDAALLSQGWKQFLFTKDQKWQGYCSFIASLFGMEFFKETHHNSMDVMHAQRTANREVSYSLISFNYDMVLENVCQYVNEYFRSAQRIKFSTDPPTAASGDLNPCLVKIHGDIESEILPPTFLKGLFQGEVPKAWRVAYNLLTHANHIRVIGYSLPQTDAYVKSLLKAATSERMDLDKIDWISLDFPRKSENEKENLESRVHDFVTFKDGRFKNGRVEQYLGSVFGWVVNRPLVADDRMSFDALEEAHEAFMEKT
jgi:hypothetical protein